MDRTVYKREYMRRKRAAQKAAKTPVTAFFAFDTIKDTPGGRYAADIDGAAFYDGANVVKVKGIDDFFKKLRTRAGAWRIITPQLGRLSHFIAAYALKSGLFSTPGIPQRGEFKISVNRWNDVVAAEVNPDGYAIVFEDFSALTPHLSRLWQRAPQGPISGSPLIDFYNAREHFIKGFYNATGVDISGCKTSSGAAMHVLMSMYGSSPVYARDAFAGDYPVLPAGLPEALRAGQAYKAGLNYAAPDAWTYRGAVTVADRHSAYPYVVANFKLPFGAPAFYSGAAAIPSDKYIIYHVTALDASIKADRLPLFALKDASRAGSTYREKIAFYGEQELYIDMYDLQLLIENYDIKFFTYDRFIAFNHAINPALKEFMNWGYKLKSDPKTAETGKTMINGLIGRFGVMPERRQTYFKNGKITHASPVKGADGYLPLAIAVNSIMRLLQARIIKENKDIYLYGDTDSLFFKATEYPLPGIKFGEKMGEFSWQYWQEFYFFGRKQYILKSGRVVKKVFAGLPEKDITDDNIKELIESGRTEVETDGLRLNADYTISPKKVKYLITRY